MTIPKWKHLENDISEKATSETKSNSEQDKPDNNNSENDTSAK